MKKPLLLLAAMAATFVVVVLGAHPAAAQVNITSQKSETSNTGVGAANTGGNSAVANTQDGDQVITTTQVAVGTPEELGNNVADESNSSSGDAEIVTGNATATGNVATTTVDQRAHTSAVPTREPTVADDAAATPASTTTPDQPIATSDGQTSPAQSAGGAALTDPAFTPGSSAGSASPSALTSSDLPGTHVGASAAPLAPPKPLDNTVQGAVSGAGPPAGLNVIDQTATVDNTGVGIANTGGNTGDDITTGDATATGNRSTNAVAQAAAADSGGLVVIDQNADIDNVGVALANTGLNEDGTIVTGNAVASGNVSETAVAQTASADPVIVVIDQDTAVDNLGVGIANTGLNSGDDITTGDATATGNHSTNAVAQAAAVASGGLVVIDQNVGIDNVGVALANTGLNEGGVIVTGNAVASGNDSETESTQDAAVAGNADPIVIGQSAAVDNVGVGIANTGLNTSDDGDVDTGDARAAGNIASTTTGQHTEVTDADPTVIDQATGVDNFGVALANTGLNEVSD